MAGTMGGTMVEEQIEEVQEGGKMKYEGISLWKSPNTGATNESSFGALASGWRDGAGFPFGMLKIINNSTVLTFW